MIYIALSRVFNLQLGKSQPAIHVLTIIIWIFLSIFMIGFELAAWKLQVDNYSSLLLEPLDVE